ncbi:MAG: ABC transporter ATP-binding protein [Bacilli bacterium]
MSTIKIENLTKTYGKGETLIRALDGINLQIESGEFVAITGKSGSGKSTLLHIIGGVDNPTSGNVFINGEDITKKNKQEMSTYRRKQVGLIYQFYNLIPVLNVKENLELTLLLDDKKPNDKTTEDFAKILGLENHLEHLPNELSGGQQQRVSIGRALMNTPLLLLADEPTGNLDQKTSDDIMKLLKKFNKELNQTIIMVTHDEQLSNQANRIIKIKDGKIIEDKNNENIK